jgi:hypothetical protein
VGRGGTVCKSIIPDIISRRVKEDEKERESRRDLIQVLRVVRGDGLLEAYGPGDVDG